MRCLASAAIRAVSVALSLTACAGVAGVAAAAEQAEQYKPNPSPQPGPTQYPFPTPQPIPPRHESECERPHHEMRTDRECGERRATCGCQERCGRDGCDMRCRPHHAWAVDRERNPACSDERDEHCGRAEREEEGEKAGALPPDGKLKLDSFTLYAERSIRLGEGDKVHGGDIGVRSVSQQTGHSQLTIGRNADVDVRRIVAAPSVAIGEDAAFGLVATDRFHHDGVALGTPAAFPAAGMPPLPLVAAGGSGADVTVGRNEALALLPGQYGALTVDGVLALNPGNYRVAKIRVGDGGRIVAIVGGVRLDIHNTLNVGRRAAIESEFDLSARQFRISVAGEDAGGAPAASFGERSRVRALVVAPHGSISFADHVLAKGAFAAFDVAAGKEVRVIFEDGLPGGEASEHGSQQLSGYYTAPIRDAPIIGPVPRSETISLAIGLPARDPNALRQGAHDVADPASPSFRKYLTLNQFAATHGATQPDYQSVIDWAKAHDLAIVATHPNRLLVDVTGSAEQIEQALYVGLNLRRRPDGSAFYAIDRDPSLDLGAKLLWISGLDNRVIARPGQGAGPGGTFNSRDLRTAYASCTNLTGAGQTVGLFELDGFTAGDITAYECQLGGATCNAAGQPTSAVPSVVTTLLDKATGAPATVNGSFEAALDIEMAIGMAPGLASVQVFEAPNTGNVAFHNDILTSMATTQPLINQLSSSWFFNTDANTQQALYEFALQGQSFLQASGDQGSASWSTDPNDIRSLDAVTVVGGTALTLTGAPSTYGSETAWNLAGQGASGGGLAANTSIPTYQNGIDMTKNGGSTTKRNLPDVAAVASNLGVVTTNPTTGTQTTGGAVGTSAAAPVWAGVIAIANQQSASTPTGAGRVGNANAFLYSIGKNPAAYGPSFNDVASGNDNGSCTGQTGTSSSICAVRVQNPITGVFSIQNTWTPGAGNFSAVAGYDLATGLGTPKCALINELATGSTTAASSSPVNITYHQTGACNGFATGTGAGSAGPNAAFVVFGIEKLDNSGGTAPFAFDPSKLYVQQAVRNFVDPSLSIYPNVLGSSAAVTMTVAKGQTIPFNVSGQAALIVQTTNANGAKEANQTPYFLKYNTSATDPAVTLTKSDAARTSWPDTEDCMAISLH